MAGLQLDRACRLYALVRQYRDIAVKAGGAANNFGYQSKASAKMATLLVSYRAAKKGSIENVMLRKSIECSALPDWFRLDGRVVKKIGNRRIEAKENDLKVANRGSQKLGLKPTTLEKGLLEEISDVAKRYAARCDQSKILPSARWRT